MNKLKKQKLFLIFTVFLFLISSVVYAPKKNYSKDDIKDFFNKEYIISTEALIREVALYIDKYGYGSNVNPELLIRFSDLYKIDLKLILAQAHLESNFGTQGIAVNTNSIFNVGTYDDGTILYQYSHPNHCIEPYLSLLKNRYLVNKTENDLLYNEFVDINGRRYASNENYEIILQKIITNIEKQIFLNIDSLQNIRKSYSIFHNITEFRYLYDMEVQNNNIFNYEKFLASL